ncbi:ROK family glucokinase [Bacillus sp. Marseille-P3661]|uniref:ROK family glucokinase n=1 Tax=Bacillus sp. Marseille-P3661 TaxID=1936234 RepID=UPI000C823E44|nr:ROK family glucokinase [Bacillus sp. Marseille-P3661]
MDKWLVGVDLGGTTIKIAFISKEGEILCKWQIATDTTNNGDNIISDITTAINKKLEELKVEKNKLLGIGIGAPAFLEIETGYVYQAVNIGWENFDLKTNLEGHIQLPVVVDNDANVAAIGEMWKGAGVGAKNIICITLGTGVGGGVITNGKIVHGANGMAGEIGHIKVIPEGGENCNCGGSGCLETVASANGMVKLALDSLSVYPQSLLNEKLKKHGVINSKIIFESAMNGDEYAKKVIDQACYYLGLAVANIANVLNPEKIIIGGGVSSAGELLLSPIKKHFQKFALKRVFERADLSVATLGNDAGVIGGAWLVKNKLIK